LLYLLQNKEKKYNAPSKTLYEYKYKKIENYFKPNFSKRILAILYNASCE